MIERHITPRIHEQLHDFSAVLLNGARQVGKSTLAQQLISQNILNEYISLDDFTALQAAEADPDGFLSQFGSQPVVIDEIQRVPDLMRALKKSIDENKQKGRFLLTGSANILSYPRVADSLAGRMSIVSLEGLSAGEIAGQQESSLFLNEIFEQNSVEEKIESWRARLKFLPTLNKKQLAEYIFFGGFPETVTQARYSFSKNWFNAYLTAYIERDVRDLNRLLDVVLFGKYFRLLGLRSANLLNVKSLCSDAGIDYRTGLRYLEIFTITFQATLLQPWFVNAAKRLIKSPKIYLNDSAMACQLNLIQKPADLLEHPAVGALFETWVFSELRKLLVYQFNIQINFYRTHQGKEVDFVLSRGGQHCGIEIKWADSVGAKDLNGLKDFQSATGQNTLGILLYTGDQVLSFGDNLLVLPISVLL